MPAEAATETSEFSASRRAADIAALKFRETELKSPTDFHKAFEEGDIEVINLDLAAPGGNDDDFQQADSSTTPASSSLTREQVQARVNLAKFKQSFESFDLTRHLAQVNMSEIKRGDVIAIKTIVGIVFLRILDRIKGMESATGEILCECRYDLGDKCNLVHSASIQLPIFTRTFSITAPDGNKRVASRQLKMRTEATLPAHVTEILHERFFVEISLYANPQREKPRLVDFGRWLIRMFLRLKAIIVANNQYEREKKLRKAQERQRLKEERAQKNKTK